MFRWLFEVISLFRQFAFPCAPSPTSSRLEAAAPSHGLGQLRLWKAVFVCSEYTQYMAQYPGASLWYGFLHLFSPHAQAPVQAAGTAPLQGRLLHGHAGCFLLPCSAAFSVFPPRLICFSPEGKTPAVWGDAQPDISGFPGK